MPMSSTAAPDLVVADARVRLAGGTFATGVAVTGDRITAVGDVADMVALAGPRTRVVRAPIGCCSPASRTATSTRRSPVATGCGSGSTTYSGKQSYLDAIAGLRRGEPGRAVDRRWRLGDGVLPRRQLPRKEDLDAVVPDRPVFLFNKDIHGAWVNQQGARDRRHHRATRPTRRTAGSSATPTARPRAVCTRGRRTPSTTTSCPRPGRAEWEDARSSRRSATCTRWASRRWQDAWVTPDDARGLHARWRPTGGSPRAWSVRCGGTGIAVSEQIERPARRSARVPGAALPRPSLRGDDGQDHDRRRASRTYTGAPARALLRRLRRSHGQPRPRPTSIATELLAAVTELDALGFQVHMHAIGDRAVRNALDAVEAARAANGTDDHRHHIAHVQVVQPEDVPRFAQLGVIGELPDLLGEAGPADGGAHDPVPRARPGRHPVPVRGDDRAAGRAARHGQRLVGHDGGPAGAARGGRDRVAERDGAPFLPEQRLRLDDAVDAFTSGSAYVNHDDDGGAIAVGRRADLALLDLDVFADGFVSGAGLRWPTRASS